MSLTTWTKRYAFKKIKLENPGSHSQGFAYEYLIHKTIWLWNTVNTDGDKYWKDYKSIKVKSKVNRI